MKYYVSFQQMGPQGRPVDYPSQSDFETNDQGFGMIPSVGDYVQIISMDGKGAKFDGKVVSRLFRYFGGEDVAHQSCGINIVVQDAEHDDWGALIKE